MAVSEEVGALVRAIRGSMGQAAGEFRRAADSSQSMTRIVRDIANIFNAQRRDLAELQNTLSESAFEAEQSSSKLDNLSSLFREMISLQSSTLGEIRDVDRGIRELDKSIFSLTNTINNQLSGLSSTTSTVGKDIIEKLGTFALGGLAGAAVGAGAASMGGGGGEGGGGAGGAGGDSQTSNFKWGMGPENLNMKAAAEAIKDIESRGSGGYTAKAPGSSASGAYQFVDETWRQASAEAGYGGKYKTARDAPPEVQDAVFNSFFQKLVKQHGLRGGILTYFTGNPQGKLTAAQQRNNITPDSYLSKFAKSYSKYDTSGSSQAQSTKPETTPQNAASATTPKGDQSQAATPQATTTPQGEQPQAPTQGSGDTSYALKPEEMGGHGHGPISGPLKDAEKTGGSAALPSGDIVALGKALEKMGIKVSEHPSFGGVHPEKHYPNSAHNDGLAIDINAPNGITEANDPVWGAKFDQLAKQIQAAGYTVLWRTRGHDNHIHAQIGGKGIKGGQSIIGGNVGQEQSTDKPKVGSDQSTQGATPVSAPSATTGMTGTPSATTGPDGAPSLASTPEGMSQLSPMAASINQQAMPLIMAGMGGMGGMSSMIAPVIGSLLGQNSQFNPAVIPSVISGIGGLASMITPAIDSIFGQDAQLPEQPPNAEITQQLSESATNSQIVAQAAVQQQAQQEMAQEAVSRPEAQAQPVNPSAPSVASSSGGDAGYGYNYPWDTAWPDWAGMLGGNHFMELQNIKKNMWR